MLAGILLGAALLLPLLLSIVLRLGEQTSRRPVALWAWADSRQQLSGLSLALMALLLALAVNVGVGTMVGSFEKTFNSWLEGRLSSELYVVAKDSAQAGEDRALAARSAGRTGNSSECASGDEARRRGDRTAWPQRSRDLSRAVATARVGCRMPGTACATGRLCWSASS